MGVLGRVTVYGVWKFGRFFSCVVRGYWIVFVGWRFVFVWRSLGGGLLGG